MPNTKNDRNVVSLVVSKELCLGCGVCTDNCNKGALKMVVSPKGLNVPVIDKQLCNNCGVCYHYCVGKGIQLNGISKKIFAEEDSIQHDEKIGYYQKCYFGYCNDLDVRVHCASGGMVSGLLIYMLEKGIIDGTVVTGFREDNPMRPRTYIARTKDEILNGKSSKYCVVSFDGIIRELKSANGRYIIVGLPCHIQAIRTCADGQPKLKERILGYFAIYCSLTKNLLSQDYLISRYKINKTSLKSFSYRDDGCMGSMKFCDNKGGTIKKVNFIDYYKPLHAFFNSERCTLCIDHYGELADMCFGDVKKDEDLEETPGESSFITRTRFFESVVQKAISDGYIHAEEISGEFLNSRQNYLRRHKKGEGIIRVYSFRRFFRRAVPHYDTDIPSKYDLSCFMYGISTLIERFIGCHKCLWFIIRLLDRTKA